MTRDPRFVASSRIVCENGIVPRGTFVNVPYGLRETTNIVGVIHE